jgi:hypothetical protein
VLGIQLPDADERSKGEAKQYSPINKTPIPLYATQIAPRERRRMHHNGGREVQGPLGCGQAAKEETNLTILAQLSKVVVEEKRKENIA